MTASPALESHAPTSRGIAPAPPFAGYPYLVARIGRTPLRAISLLPGGMPVTTLLAITREVVAATGLEAALALGPSEAHGFARDLEGRVRATGTGPVPTGIVVPRGLALPASVAAVPELAARAASLAGYTAAQHATGYLVGDGLEAGRPATGYDVARLYAPRPTPDAVAPVGPGLRRCSRCAELAGDYLALEGEGNGDLTPRVIAVECRCANDNRCARCGVPLADRRLSSYAYDEAAGQVSYLAAYAALGHRCAKEA